MFSTLLTVLWRITNIGAASTISETAYAMPRKQPYFDKYNSIGWIEPTSVASPNHQWISLYEGSRCLVNLLRLVIWIPAEPYIHCFVFAPLDSTAYHMAQTLNRRLKERSHEKYRLYDPTLDLRGIATRAWESGLLRAWEEEQSTDAETTIRIHRLKRPPSPPIEFQRITSITLTIADRECVVYPENGFRMDLFPTVPGPALLSDCYHLCESFLDATAGLYKVKE